MALACTLAPFSTAACIRVTVQRLSGGGIFYTGPRPENFLTRPMTSGASTQLASENGHTTRLASHPGNPLLPLRGGLARAHARPIGIGPTARSASEYQPETRLGIAIYGGARRRHRKRPVYGPYHPSSIAFTVMVYGGRLRENRARFTGGNTREPDPAFCRTIPIGAARRGGLTAGLSAGSLADEVYRA